MNMSPCLPAVCKNTSPIYLLAERLPVAEASEDLQPVFRDEVIRPDPSVPIFEDLFDGDWGEDNDEQLHNYVNINRGVQSRLGLSPPTADERIRSVSMPPDIRYYRDSSLGDNNYELQRAVSMEPAINTTASTEISWFDLKDDPNNANKTRIKSHDGNVTEPSKVVATRRDNLKVIMVITLLRD
ncbi:hypothetical protein INT48_007082 [Thamnidium elegans]|uniref:Uncharacterized protein n=1 Tax=Thamnidium elegans TaxID=101142 RepID=A0A8H7VN88_9FUNG|nr:hypothetical protein INT48_007082 [Thamnidium elegans]